MGWLDWEEEMERQTEIEMERELVGWRHKTEVLEDIRKSLIDDGIAYGDEIDTEDSFRIRCERYIDR
jgi:hypothetical protein